MGAGDTVLGGANQGAHGIESRVARATNPLAVAGVSRPLTKRGAGTWCREVRRASRGWQIRAVPSPGAGPAAWVKAASAEKPWPRTKSNPLSLMVRQCQFRS
jgi:hypothetical protein